MRQLLRDFFHHEEAGVHILHYVVTFRSPVTINGGQFKLATGISCPRHRRILKAKLGPLGRLLPYREWVYDASDGAYGHAALVSVRDERIAEFLSRGNR